MYLRSFQSIIKLRNYADGFIHFFGYKPTMYLSTYTNDGKIGEDEYIISINEVSVSTGTIEGKILRTREIGKELKDRVADHYVVSFT